MLFCKCLQYCIDQYKPIVIILIENLDLFAKITRSTIKNHKSYPDLLESIGNTVLHPVKNRILSRYVLECGLTKRSLFRSDLYPVPR